MIDLANIKYISFDCYGTLIDWEQGILSTLANVFSNYRSHSQVEVLQSFARWEAEIESFFFEPYHKVLVKVLRGMASEFSLELDDDELLANSVRTWEPFPDTTKALQQLQQKYPLAILSNVDQHMFSATSQKLLISFDHVCLSEEIGAYKPSRRNFEFLLDRLNCDSSCLLHIAQSLYHDHAPAREIGIRSVWLNRPSVVPGQGATISTATRPETEVGTMAELVEMLAPESPRPPR